MTTSVSICSNALLMLGHKPISDFGDGSDVGRTCANLYPDNRDALLRSHLWNCAIKRVQLTPLVDAPAFEFGKAFLLPGDWLRTLRIGREGNYVSTDFRQEGRQILSNASTLYLRYVFRNEDEGTYDALLIDALTARMAWKLAYPVTKSTSLSESLRAQYMAALAQAKSIDAMEEPGDMIAEDTPLLNSRF